MPAKKAKTPVRKSTQSDFEKHLGKLPHDQRAALEKLRQAIHAAVPGLEECISYGLPAFRLNGKFLVAMGGAKEHCAFYPGAVLANLGVDLSKYDLSKGTIRFPADKPLPATLVKKIMKARMARDAARK